MMTPLETEHLTHCEVEHDSDGLTTVWLNRPDSLNAFNARLISELTTVFTVLGDHAPTRVIVLRGRGKVFCAGADINWMRESVEYTRQQNVDDATRMAHMMAAIASCSKPTICAVHGLAIGGGIGLLSAADYCIATADASFAFSEVKLGILPAVIAPFVMARIGPGQARPLFLSGERFDAQRAWHIGLVHTLVSNEQELETEIERMIAEFATSAPDAMATCKRLIDEISWSHWRHAMSQTVETIATKRTDPEGQEGLSAFLEKRKPEWISGSAQPSWVK